MVSDYLYSINLCAHALIIIRIKSIIMIEMHKHVIRCWKDYVLRYVNKNVNNATSSQWRGSRAWIARNLINQITVVHYFVFKKPTLKICLISTYWICFSTRDHNKKWLRYAKSYNYIRNHGSGSTIDVHRYNILKCAVW